MIMKCNRCKEEFNATPFFHTPSVTKEYNPTIMADLNIVSVFAKTICPFCGDTLNERYTTTLGFEDIVIIATRGAGALRRSD